MKIISSYKIKILNCSKIFDDTFKIYKKAVSFFINVLDKEWVENNMEELSDFDKTALMDKLTNRTKQNRDVKYDFKEKFPSFPSNYRSSALQAAIGSYSSYFSSLKNWEKEDEETRGQKPTMQSKRNLSPTLYKSMNNVYVRSSFNEARIKIYYNGVWQWKEFKLKEQNVRNIQKKVGDAKEDSPTLLKQGNRYFLSFPYEMSTKLETVKVKKQTIASVYLGIDPHATISIMNYKGEILARHFINYKDLQAKLVTSCNRIKKCQKHGSIHMPYKWRHVNDINTEIARRVSKEIVEFASKYNFNVIVFEHINKNGKKHSTNKQTLSLWRGREIQKLVEHKAHILGKRISTVNGYNSRYIAFDGTGKFEKPKNNITKFVSGKNYNIALNASYIIGARYFIRELTKENSKFKNKTKEELEELFGKSSDQTLDTLIKLNKQFK